MPITRRVAFVQPVLLAMCLAACGAADKIATESELRSEWGEPCSSDGNSSMEVWHYCAAPCPDADGEWCHTACSEGCAPQWSISISNGLIIHTDGPEGGR